MKTLTAVDLFCGAGGTSTGLARACDASGLKLSLLAINHWPVAIETHGFNHPSTEHLCVRVDQVDPHRAVSGRLDLLMASPECTHFSNSRGGMPMQDQSRASAWEVVRWATALRPRWILVENVREFLTWGPLGQDGRPLKTKRGETFAAWAQALRSLNYTVEWRILNSADYGAATARRRLFILARLGQHRALPWPAVTHAPADWRPAREIVDWSLPGESIFRRRRPLAEATLRRIEAGLRKFGGQHAEAFLVVLRNNQDARELSLPLPTITCSGAHFGLCEPFVVPFFGERSGQLPRVHSIQEPLATVTGQGAGALVEPFLVRFQGSHHGQQDATGRVHQLSLPLPCLDTSNRYGLVRPFVLGQQSCASPRGVDQPLPTISTAGAISLVQPFLVNYNGQGHAYPLTEPLRTQTSKDRFGLVRPTDLDIRFRMLQPHELSAAMGFPAGYRFAGNKADRVRQIGNAVEVNQAEALTSAILEAA